MVRVGSYCIDSTEVTNRQYAEFALAAVSPGNVADCEWKSSFTTPSLDTSTFNLPVGNVDWCDAKAYCQWAGKRLCGRIGGGALPNDSLSTTDPDLDEWYRVCSNDGALKYVYGQSYDSTKCNSSSTGLLAVGSLASCTAANGTVYDLNGNTWEWINACDDVAADGPQAVQCQHRGGSYGFNDISCLDHLAQVRSFTAYDLGFRCCSD